MKNSQRGGRYIKDPVTGKWRNMKNTNVITKNTKTTNAPTNTHERIAQRIMLPNYTNKKSKGYSKTKPIGVSNKEYKANTYMRGILNREEAIRQDKFRKEKNKRLRTTYNQTQNTHKYHNHPNNNNKNEPAPEMWKGFNENKMHQMRSFYNNLNTGYKGSETKNNLKMQREYYKRHNNRQVKNGSQDYRIQEQTEEEE